MQLTNFLAIFALTAIGVSAAPGNTRPGPPPPPSKPQKPQKPPVINNQVNYCSSGSPYCCSPTDGDKGSGTTCKKSTTQCNSISICCNNAQNADGTAATSVSCTQILTAATSIVTSTLEPLSTANSSPPSRPRPALLPALFSSPSDSRLISSFLVFVAALAVQFV